MADTLIIEGVVQRGRQLGRQLGFPTANLKVAPSVVADDGVYYARVEVDGILYDAMANLGCNPSVGCSERRLESHLLQFEGDLYGKHIRVHLLRKIRSERKFDTLAELQAQIAADRITIAHLARH